MAVLYPRKNTVLIFAICAIIVGAASYVERRKTPATELASNSKVELGSTAKEITGPLTENWQKQFLKESDSTSVKFRSDPALKTDDEELTTTDKIGRNFFAQYISLAQNNLLNDDRFVNGVAERTIDEAVAAIKPPVSYEEKDLAVSQAVDATSLRIYGNAVANVLSNDGPRDNSVLIAGKAIEEDNMRLLADIDPIVTAYDSMLAKLAATLVPKQMTPDHLALMNSLSAIRYLAEGLRNLDKDPMQAIVALGAHASAETAAETALANMKMAFVNAGIKFDNAETGKLFEIAALKVQ